MLVLSSLKRRTYAAVGVASTCAFVLLSLSPPATAQQVTIPAALPVVQLANPSSGDVLATGDYIVTGTAYDPAATEGAGVSRVDLFLGRREAGGTFLGSAVPGEDTITNVTPDSRLAQTGFQITVTLPTAATGGADFVAYAYSSVTGREASVIAPIYIGAAAAPTPLTDEAPQPVVESSMPAAATAGTAMFSLANPSKGDVVLKGDYIVSGATGSAIDRVELFLGDRDAGGTHLGTVVPVNGTFSTRVTIPENSFGGQKFCAYALASTTGQESEVEVPIFVGAPPTPTPHPAT
jgi:hypothetical protein